MHTSLPWFCDLSDGDRPRLDLVLLGMGSGWPHCLAFPRDRGTRRAEIVGAAQSGGEAWHAPPDHDLSPAE